MSRQFVRASHSFSQLQGILSKMKVSSEVEFPKEISKLGTSHLFGYATNKKYAGKGMQSNELKVWNKLLNQDINNVRIRIPLNGFEEAIQMTEEGRLWQYPIDNEIGLDAEKKVPFEEHVFLDDHLKDFPDNESIRNFMALVISGLAKNPWMTAERKRDIIKYYRDYFETKRETYKMGGFDL